MGRTRAKVIANRVLVRLTGHHLVQGQPGSLPPVAKQRIAASRRRADRAEAATRRSQQQLETSQRQREELQQRLKTTQKQLEKAHRRTRNLQQTLKEVREGTKRRANLRPVWPLEPGQWDEQDPFEDS